MDPNIVILAAGISSRMKRTDPGQESVDPNLAREAQTKTKSMIGLGEGRRPFLDYLLFNVLLVSVFGFTATWAVRALEEKLWTAGK